MARKPSKKSRKRSKTLSSKSAKSRPLFKERTWILILVGIVIIALVAMCAIPEERAPETPEYVPEDVPVVPEEPEIPEEPEPVVETPLDPAPNPEVVELFSSLDKVKSYRINAKRLSTERGDLKQTHLGIYSVVGDKARIELMESLLIGDKGVGEEAWNADYVFLDLARNDAAAYCLESSTCRDRQLKADVEFSRFDIPLPVEWVEDIQFGEITTQRMYENRRVHVVRWQEEDLYYEAYLDDFYGIPMRVTWSIDPTYERITGGYTYTDLAINRVPESDVVPPY